MRVLILGCGYVGQSLGELLARQGHDVLGVRRTLTDNSPPPDAPPALKFIAADVTRPPDLAALPGPFDWVINAVSSTRGGVEEYRSVYLEGTRHVVDWLNGQPLRRYVHLSSTSVYGQSDGSRVHEQSPTQPTSPTSRVLVETEELLRTAAGTRQFPAVLLRVAGIYGPERGHLFQQYLRNEARLQGHGERLINMIHRDDVVAAIMTALTHGRPGETYNVVDDEPVTQLHFFRWLSETLGKPMPPFATAEEDASRKRGLTNKKVSNRRLRMELGLQLKYPTFRQGYSAEIQRLEKAGVIESAP